MQTIVLLIIKQREGLQGHTNMNSDDNDYTINDNEIEYNTPSHQLTYQDLPQAYRS